MKLSQFSAYYLPPVKVETLQVSVQLVDAFSQADEEDGRMPTMGTLPALIDTATIQATHMISRSFLIKPIPGSVLHYAEDEGGLDSALFDFSEQVLAGGLQTLTMLPSGGTSPVAGIYGSGAAITSWTCDAEVSSNYQIARHVGGAQAYAEITVTYEIASGYLTVNTAAGAINIPLV